jgi:hypothetical protein
LHALATATQRRRPRFQRTAFHPETRPDRADTSVSVRGGVSVFSRNALFYDVRLFFFFVRAYALGDAAEIDARESSRNTTSVVASVWSHPLMTTPNA